MSYISNISNNFVLTWDAGIIAFLFLAAFFYGLSMGRRRLVVLLSSAYFALVLTALLPFTNKMENLAPILNIVGIKPTAFVLFSALTFAFLSGSVFRSSFKIPKKEQSSWWHLFLISFATVGFLTSTILAFLPQAYYNNLSLLVRVFFVDNNANFIWALGGILTLVILRKRS